MQEGDFVYLKPLREYWLSTFKTTLHCVSRAHEVFKLIEPHFYMVKK